MSLNQLPQTACATKGKAPAHQPQATKISPQAPKDIPVTVTFTEIRSVVNLKKETDQEFWLNEQNGKGPLTISQPTNPNRSGTANSQPLITAVPNECTSASPEYALTPDELTKHQVWVVGRASAADMLINYLGPLTCLLAFRKTTQLHHIIETVQNQPVGHQQVIIVLSATLTYADLNALRQLTVSRSDISVAVCFSTAHLGIISYAWALEFTAYFTGQDAALESRRVITQLIDGTPESSVYSEVFCEWLRRYGILFEYDREPFS